MTLVNKDQLDILATLRESVNEDKVELEAEVERLRGQIKELADKNKMQLEQINGLLLEKVNLQSEGLDQRDRMLQRERAIGDLRASMSGKDLPEDIKQRMLALHEENISLKEQYKTAQEKLVKAKAVRHRGVPLPSVWRLTCACSSSSSKTSSSRRSTRRAPGVSHRCVSGRHRQQHMLTVVSR